MRVVLLVLDSKHKKSHGISAVCMQLPIGSIKIWSIYNINGKCLTIHFTKHLAVEFRIHCAVFTCDIVTGCC